MANSPLTEDSNLVSFSILSNGIEIPDTFEVVSIETTQFVNRIAEAEIILRDGDHSNQTFEISDSETFAPGAQIEIKLGYHSKNESVFKGIVVKQIVKIDADDGSMLQIVCKDEALKMNVNEKSAIFKEMTDSNIIDKIASEYRFSKNIAATTNVQQELVQYNATDWDFIVNRAEINGMIVFTDSGTLTVAKPDVSSSPELKLQFGQDIIAFDSELDATNQYEDAKAKAWNLATQSCSEASSTEPTVNEQGNITGKKLAEALSAGTSVLISYSNLSNAELQNWTNAALLKSRLSRFQGTITFQGSSKAKANTLLELNGVGKRFNGNAYVSGVVHTVQDGSWTTEAHFGLKSEWFSENNTISAPLTSGLLPGVHGLQTGVVKKIHDDPENQFRVQVEMPLIDATNELVWARLATLYSGNGFGAYFIPEVGDEVVLGFTNGDPRSPIILGSVHSSKHTPPEIPDADNAIKTLITKSKLQLKFDDVKKEITLNTASGNTIVIGDDSKSVVITDQHANKIEMHSGGINIESNSDLTLKAANSVIIEGASIKIDGKQSVKVTSNDIDVSSDVTTRIMGGAECSITSNGNLTAQGAMVMIN